MRQTIASVRMHVERIITRIEKFKVLKTEIPLNLIGTDHKPNMNSGLSSLQLYGPTQYSLSNNEVKILPFTQSASVIIYKGQVGLHPKNLFPFSPFCDGNNSLWRMTDNYFYFHDFTPVPF